jgi:hypothetical protein
LYTASELAAAATEEREQPENLKQEIDQRVASRPSFGEGQVCSVVERRG